MSDTGRKRWVSAHAAAPFEAYSGFVPDVTGRTVSCSMRVSAGGERMRIAMTERMGSHPVTYGHIAVSAGGRTCDVTFGGSREVTVPAEGETVSDPVELPIASGDTVTLWLYNSGERGSVTATRLDSRHSVPGDMCGMDFEPESFESQDGSIGEPLCSYSRIEVETCDPEAFSIAAFGDSITAMELWTAPLRERLNRLNPNASLVNLGIGGNRLLRDTGFPMHPDTQFFGRAGLNRFEADCLSQSGLNGIIIALGINDLGAPGDDPYWNPPRSEFPTFEQLIGGLAELTARCRARGLNVACATITPLCGTWTYSEDVEDMRCAVNDWIKSCGLFDTVLDFDAAIGQGTDRPMQAQYDSGDHLHPNKEGGRAMADAVDAADLLRVMSRRS